MNYLHEVLLEVASPILVKVKSDHGREKRYSTNPVVAAIALVRQLHVDAVQMQASVLFVRLKGTGEEQISVISRKESN